MRINTFRSWVNTAWQQGYGAAKRAGLAISRRIKEATGKVDAGVGVGDDESSFGGGRGSRAWMELIEEYIRRVKSFFEKSTFEKFPRFESFMRKLLGIEAPQAPALPPPKPKPKARYKGPSPVSAEQAARMKAQLQAGRMRAKTQDKLTIRQIERQRRERERREEVERHELETAATDASVPVFEDAPKPPKPKRRVVTVDDLPDRS